MAARSLTFRRSDPAGRRARAGWAAILVVLLGTGGLHAFTSQEHLDEKARGIFEDARALELQGQASRALRKYKGLVAAYPRTEPAAQAQFQIARLYHSNEEYENAFRAYESVINDYPGSALFLESVEGEFTVAAEVFRRMTRAERSPDRAPEIDLPDMLTLRDMFRVIITQGPRTEFAPQALYYLAVTYQKENDADTARQIFERFNDEYPRSTRSDDAAFQIAFIEFQKGTREGVHRGRLRQARLYFEDFLIRFSGSDKVPEAKFLLGRIERHELAYLRRAAAFYEKQGHAEAAKVYRAESAKIVAKHSGEAAAEAELAGEPVDDALADPAPAAPEPESPHPPIILRQRGEEPEVVQP